MDLADVPRHRPLAFDKMESLIKEMQDPETGVPVRSQKLFLTYIPAAFMGYDLVEWLMERFNLDETSNVEAINLANQLCQFGYFFPVNDSKNLVLKDDSSLYRFQSPYYWPWQSSRPGGGSGGACAASLGPDNVEYAIYLVKRTLRNKQRHGLEEYELEALANLKKNLAAKWDFITMQAEEQVRLAKERKKGDKIVSDSQERAYWRVVRPPPGVPSALEACPVPVRARPPRNKQREIQFLTKEIEYLRSSLERTCAKSSVAVEGLVAYAETLAPYDPWITPAQPNNPWVTDDTTFWQINSPLVDIPSDKRVQRWALSIEELVSDPTGLQEFTNFLRKEYSHENIRFWLAVVDLRRSSAKQVPQKLQQIYEEFLKPGAPCEINIDGATAEQAAAGVKSGSRFAFDQAADHVYNLLLKKDCYPRFVRSDHFQRLIAEGRNVHQKKAKFFNFGGGGQIKKKPGSTSTGSSSSGGVGAVGGTGGPGTVGSASLSRRRGSERSLSGSAHELAYCAARTSDTPSHSHSQSNLADIAPFREGSSEEEASGSEVSRGRRLPQQSTLDGGLRGAAPPLRRLSAVEPRMSPSDSRTTSSSSPPSSPAAPSVMVSPPPNVTVPPSIPCVVCIDVTTTPAVPTALVEVTLSSDTPILCTSVSTCVTPPTPPVVSASMTASSLSSITEAEPTTPSSSSSTTPVTTTLLSLTETPSPARGISTSPTKALVTVDASTSSPVVASTIPVAEEPSTSRMPPPITVESLLSLSMLPTSTTLSSLSPAASSSSTALCISASVTSDVITTSTVTSVTLVATPSSSSSTPSISAATASGSVAGSASSARVAPLAECEVSAVEEERADVVVPSPTTMTLHADTDVTITIAHKDELSSTSEHNIVKRDNNSSDCKQRNDICPWEDENSCESDAPFVKTYATLGYL